MNQVRVKKVAGTTVHFWPSSKISKKWMTIDPKGHRVYWGDPNMQDYLEHGNKQRRLRYRQRHAGILLKDGTRAIDKKWSPAWLSYNVTW
jgi:hypothetical protein